MQRLSQSSVASDGLPPPVASPRSGSQFANFVAPELRHSGSSLGADTPLVTSPSSRSVDSFEMKVVKPYKVGSLANTVLIKVPASIILHAFVFVLSLVYLVVRLLIHLVDEYLTLKSFRLLRSKMKNTSDFQEYKKLAVLIDEQTGLRRWRDDPKSDMYQYKELRKASVEMKTFMAENTALKNLAKIVHASLGTETFGQLFTEELFSKTYYGTKLVVEEYLETICSALTRMTESVKAFKQHNKAGKDNSDKAEKDSSDNQAEFNGLSELACQVYAKFQDASTNFGETALVLSGGANMTLQHYGVCHALYKNGVLPRIISGTSGGCGAAVFFATRTDAEIERDFSPEFLHNLHLLFDDSWSTTIKRFLRKGYILDPVDMREKTKRFLVVETMTFAEAYARSGRVLNICAAAKADRRSNKYVEVMFNHLETPNVLVHTAMQASCTFPLISRPVPVLEKLVSPKAPCASSSAARQRFNSESQAYEAKVIREPSDSQDPTDQNQPIRADPAATRLKAGGVGTTEPRVLAEPRFGQEPHVGDPPRIREKSKCFYDGTLVCDVPKKYLSERLGAKYTIVSQVNPHVTPFFFSPKGEAGIPIHVGPMSDMRGGYLLSVLESTLKELMRSGLRLAQNIDADLHVREIPMSHVFLQDMCGSVTMHNTHSLLYKYCRLLANSSGVSDMKWWISEGYRMAFPKICLLQWRRRVEKALTELDDCIHKP